jgi:hypothetical protein
MRRARHARPLLSLVALALIAFWPLVLHPTQTLYSDTNDLLAEHLPAKVFLVRSLRETGELPLWNPEQYAGSPFVHDIQVGLFYPPHLPLYFISEPAVGPFMSWLVFAHVVLAGWLMYAYGRHAGMDEIAAIVAGCGYMLAPRWMAQLFLAGHTVTIGLAWLPLILLCVERAIQRRRWIWAVGGGVAYALFVLGTHPQWTFYGSLLVGLWPLRLLTDVHIKRPLLVRWLAVEGIVVTVGLGLCAVQLLPTFEAAVEASRAKGMGQSWGLIGAKAAVETLIGPFPDRVATNVHWETRAGIGLTWAVLAIVGAVAGGRATRVPTYIALGILAFALGGSLLFERVPGFSMFRMPTRVLLTLAFPVAYLAAVGVHRTRDVWPTSHLVRSTVVVVGVVALPVLVALAVSLMRGHPIPVPHLRETSPAWRSYWLILPGAWISFLRVGPHVSGAARARFAGAILVADLLLFILPYPDTLPMEEIYPRSPLIDPLLDEGQLPGSRVYDPEADDTGGCFLGAGSPVASAHGVRSVRGYNPLDVARYRQFLAFIADVGEPQKAFSGDFTHPVTVGFPIQNRSLFDLLGVAWVIAPVDDPPGGDNWATYAGWTDPAPRSYNFLGRGVQELPPMRIYVNMQSMPRAFLVPGAVPEAAEGEGLQQLKGLDLWQTATLADWEHKRHPLPAPRPRHPTRLIRSERPNEIVISLDGRSAGLLVVSDPWYPGWVCRIDGEEAPVWRADYAFRGVIVPVGSREVVFRFEPKSYRRGKWISVVTLGVVVIAFAIVAARSRRRM